MSFYERLDSLLRQKNISQRRMIIDFGLGKNTMFNWKHRNNIPNGEVLLKLSEYLDVSVDYLLCNSRHCLNEEEMLLLNEYRKLNKQQREDVLNIIKANSPVGTKAGRRLLSCFYFFQKSIDKIKSIEYNIISSRNVVRKQEFSVSPTKLNSRSGSVKWWSRGACQYALFGRALGGFCISNHKLDRLMLKRKICKSFAVKAKLFF